MQHTSETNTQTSSGVLDAFFRRLFFAGDIHVGHARAQTVQAADVLKLFGEALRTRIRLICFIIGAVILGSIGGLVIPLYYKKFFDLLSGGGAGLQVHELRIVILMIFGLNFLNFVAWRSVNFGNQYLAAKTMARLREQAFAHLINHSQRFFSNTFTGTLVQRVNRFAGAYDRLADRFIYNIIPIVIQVIGIISVLLAEHWSIAVIILVWTIVFIACNYYFARWKLKYDIASAEQDSKTTGTLSDIITNQPTIDAHGSHTIEKERYKSQVDRQAHMNRFRWNLGESMETVQSFLIILVEFGVFYVGINLWKKGEFSVGMFVLVQTYIITLSERLWSFSRIIRDVYESFADAKEMAEIMLTPHEIIEGEDAHTLIGADGDIRFEHVSFGYQSEHIIDDMNLTIKAGERVAFVGPSGAGKSTIVKLLFRFYDPTQGTLRIDGRDIRTLSLASLRETLSLVPQDPILFHRSLMDNIRYGRPGATDAEVIVASRLAHCDIFIERLPKKYETLVGERGIKLSGGERQRVALARAFLRNAPIIVLDEATSSLDSESERYIQSALANLMEGRTTLVIAHRLSTIKSMDRIVVIENGYITQDGGHDELIARGGMYAHLWSLQQSGFIAEEDEG